MADSQIKMILSLVDNASPALNGFLAKLKALESALSSANAAFSKFNAGISPASAGVGKATSEFEKAAQALAALDAKLSSASSHYANLGSAASSASTRINSATNELNHAGGAAQRFDGHLSTLATSIKAVGELWGAAKIGQGLEHAGEEAAKYEMTQTRIANMNLGDADNAMLKAEAERISKMMPQIDQNEILKMGQDLVNVTGNAKEATHEMERFVKAAYAMKMADPAGVLKDRDVLNIAKSLEMRGASMDPERMHAEMEKFAQVFAATQGRVGTGALLGNIKYSKGGLGNSMDIDFLAPFAAMIEMVQSSGGNGGQVGTMLTTLQRVIQNGPEHARRGNWKDNGLLDAKGNVVGADDFSRNPYKWVQEVFKPALQKAGVDMADVARVNQIINSLTGNRNAAEALSIMTTRSGQIDKDVKVINNTAGIDEQNLRNLATAKAAWDGIKGSIENLAMTIGEQILPAFKELADWITKGVTKMDEFFKGNETAAMGAVIVAAIAGISLAIMSAATAFGMLIPASSLAAAGMLVPMLQFVTRMGIIGVASATAFTAGFVFFNAIKNFEVFGDTIENYTARLVGRLIGNFARFVNFISGAVLGGISKLMNASSIALGGVGLDKLSGEAAASSRAVDQFRRDIDANAKQAMDWSKSYGQKRSIAPAPATAAAPHFEPGGVDLGASGIGWDGKREKDGFKINPRGAKEAGSGAGRSRIDPQARVESESVRLEKEALAIQLQDIERLYRDNKASVEDTYAAKTAAIVKGTADQVAGLEREKAILAKDSKRNAGAIARVDTDIAIAQMREKSKLLDLEVEKRAALERIARDGLQIEAKNEAAMMSGTEKRIALLDEEYRKKREILVINGKMAQAAALDEQKAMEIAKLQEEFLQQQLARQRAAISLKAEALKNAVSSGGMTSLEAAQKTNDLRMEEGRLIDELIDKMEQYAIASKNPALLDNLKKMRVEAEGLKYQFDEVTKAVRGGFSSGIEDALSALQGGKGMRAALRSLEQGILAPINAMVNKNVSEMLTNKLFGQADGTGAGTGFLGKIGQQLFGSGAAGAGVSKFAEKSGQSPADLANNALSKLASDGAAASTTALVENATKSTLGATAQSMATMALQSLTTAAQTAAMALQSMGGGSGGGGGILGSLFGGGGSASIGMDGAGDGFTSFFAGLPSFDVGADSLPRDMIAKIHKDEMILPAATAAKVRAGLSSGKGGAGLTVNNNFNVSGETSRDTMNQIATKVASSLDRAQRRNGR